MNAATDFPEQDDVTPAWLAEALGFPGAVPAVEQRSIGTGQVGENVRYTFQWPDGVDGPASVVGKFPSPDPISRETAAATNSYVREIGFYRDLQDTVTIRTPTIHALYEALDANRFLLLMEDIAPARQGDQIDGCSPEQAALAVEELAGLHAAHWGAAIDLEWMTPRSPERAAEHAGLYQMVFPGFVERYGERLGSDVVAIGERLGERMVDWFGAYRTPQTLVHGDYRLDNMLFGTAPEAPPLTVVDWQTAAYGHGPADVAYFLGAGLMPDVRRDVDRELVDVYRAKMIEAGIDLDAGVLEHDVAIGSASGYVMAVIASMIVGRTERGDEMFCVMAERHADQMGAWGCLERV